MSVKLTAEKDELIKSIAKDQGFSDYTIDVGSGSIKGDGYLGIINTIQIQSKNQPHKTLNLILKSALDGDKVRELAPVRKAYGREIYLYETVFPELKKFQQEYGIQNKFEQHAKCYGSLFTEKQECLILENLRTLNYRLWDRMQPMNSDHVGLGFETYGKLHGASMALKRLKPEKYEELAKNLFNIFEDNSEEALKKFQDNMKQFFENGFKAVAGDERATSGIMRFMQQSRTFFMEELKEVGKFHSILHGDCWCNNMMFKYNDPAEPKKLTGMCLLDWQISHMGSCIMDLSYFFYASASKEVLVDLPIFLRRYYGSLTTVLKEAGCNSEDIPSFEELELEWKRLSKYGLFMTFFVIKIVLSEVDEAPDFSELANDGKNILESLNNTGDGVHAEKVNKRIADVINFMIDNEYL